MRGKKEIAQAMLLLAAMFLFKCAVDYGYWTYLSIDSATYRFDFNLWKYINGMIWCFLLFCGIANTKRKASSFFLYMILLLQIVPITTIYALGNDNALYYNVLCMCFFVCELIVRVPFQKISAAQIKHLAPFLYYALLTACIVLLYMIVKNNGKPSLTALNIYDVYELRSSGSFVLNKYLNYLLSWAMAVILPLVITRCLLKKKVMGALLACLAVGLIYLYTGHKTYLFSVPMVVVCVLWSTRKKFYTEIFSLASVGFAVLTFGANRSSLLSAVFSLFGRRVMLLSANNKFKYFDFFSKNQKMGLAGIFPRWIINVTNPYPEGIGYVIAREYFNKPEMNSNTGFFAEGYMRFGWVGMILSMVLFGCILRLMDSFAEKNSYQLCIGLCVYSIFTLSDGHLIDSLILGPWMLLMIILLWYQDKTGRRVLRKWKISRERYYWKKEKVIE